MAEPEPEPAKPGPDPSRRVRRRTSAGRSAERERARPQRTAPAHEVCEPRNSYDDPASLDAQKDNDRGVRALVASGPSQISRYATMRTRDINRPTDEELAAAEEQVDIVRRHWKPPTD